MAKRLPPEPEGALYVRLPAEAVDKLGRASQVLGIHKKDLIAGLVAKYVDPDSRSGLNAHAAVSQPRRGSLDISDAAPSVGAYSFRPYDPPEVLTAEQVAQLLQLDEKIVLELAQAGDLPGRKLGPAWRFSRTAVLAWLATPERR